MGKILEYVEDYMTAPVGTTVEAVTGHDDDDDDKEIITQWRKSAEHGGWVVVRDGGVSVLDGRVMTNDQMADDGPTEVVES